MIYALRARYVPPSLKRETRDNGFFYRWRYYHESNPNRISWLSLLATKIISLINTLKRNVTVKKSLKYYVSLQSYGLLFFVMLKSSLVSFYPHYNTPFSILHNLLLEEDRRYHELHENAKNDRNG